MDRQRLTITMKKDLIKKVDQVIDDIRIRNRSHAIEYLLSKALGTKISKAFILAGGHGIKMRPFTYEMPKCMLPVHNRPILDHIIEKLREFNIREIILSIDYLGDKIKDYFGDGSKFGVKITYLISEKSTGSAKPLIQAKKLINSSPFVLWHGDVLADINLTDLIDYHEKSKELVTMALTSVADPSAYGAIKMHGNRIVEFREKAGGGPDISRLINAGIYIMDPKAINLISSKKTKLFLEQDLIPQLVKSKKIIGYLFEGQWFDISTPKMYERALKEWCR